MRQTNLKRLVLVTVPKLALVLACVLGETSSRASQVVIPGSLAAAEGNANTTVSGFVGSSNITWQTQITAAELSTLGLNIGDQITGVRQRLNGAAAAGPASDINLSDLEITMGVAANAIGSMSTTFADNMTNPVIVRDGAYTLAANAMPSGNSPNAFGPLVSFGSAYTYQGGALIFMYTRPATSSLSLDFATTYTGAGTAYRSLVANGTHHALSGSLDNAMSVFQFEVDVPEPASMGVISIGLSGLLLRRRSNR